MARAINSQDNYRERLLKQIPSEVLAVYIAGLGLILSLEAPPVWLQWLIFGLCLVATPFWLIYSQKVRSVLQNILAGISFVLFCMTIPGPFTAIEGYQPIIGSLLLLVFIGLVAPLAGKMAA